MRKGNRGAFKSKPFKPERQKTPLDIHNETVNGIIGRITSPTIKAGGKQDDVMRLLESVCAGVIANLVAEGHEGEVLRVFHSHVLGRIVEVRQRKYRHDQDTALAEKTRKEQALKAAEAEAAVKVIDKPKIITG